MVIGCKWVKVSYRNKLGVLHSCLAVALQKLLGVISELVLGDFNFHALIEEASVVHELMGPMIILNLSQAIMVPTNINRHMLNLVFTLDQIRHESTDIRHYHFLVTPQI